LVGFACLALAESSAEESGAGISLSDCARERETHRGNDKEEWTTMADTPR
jgi:hypothetical protein